MSRVDGPLYYERMGRAGPVMAFMPPNPMDQACWIYQVQHFSTWFRCIAIDTPGYGRSPTAQDGVTQAEIAQAFWDAIDEIDPVGKAILVGCSGGFMYALRMQQLHPERTAAVVLTGAGLIEDAAGERLRSYEREGLTYRRRHIAMDFSPGFNATPMGRYIADLFIERDSLLDLETIKRQYRAHAMPDPDRPADEQPTRPTDSALDVKAPTIILAGTEDALFERSYLLRDRIPGCEHQVLPGAGHACQLEQPWLFDELLLQFLEKHGLVDRTQPAR